MATGEAVTATGEAVLVTGVMARVQWMATERVRARAQLAWAAAQACPHQEQRVREVQVG